MTTSNDYSGKRVLVTGGTGSFGKTVAKHLLERGIDEVCANRSQLSAA